ncbi:MAG: hypothetical protein WD751_11120 [Anaerolineales bacterium]
MDQAAPLVGGIHPYILVYPTGENHPLNISIPEEWYPKEIDDLQLVACISELKQNIEECNYYGGPSIIRYQYRVIVNVVEARSGFPIGGNFFIGSEPRHCGHSEAISVTELTGKHVDPGVVWGWLSVYIRYQLDGQSRK